MRIALAIGYHANQEQRSWRRGQALNGMIRQGRAGRGPPQPLTLTRPRSKVQMEAPMVLCHLFSLQLSPVNEESSHICVCTQVCTCKLYPFDPNSQPFSSPCRLSVLHLCYGPSMSRSGEAAHIGAGSILRALWEWNSRIPVLGAWFRFRGVTGRINSSQYWHMKICRVLPTRKAPPSLMSRVFIGVQSHLWFTSHMLELSLKFFQRLSSYLLTPSLWSYSRYHVAKISLHKHIVRLSSVVQTLTDKQWHLPKGHLSAYQAKAKYFSG